MIQLRCWLCWDPTSEREGKYRDLGDDTESLVCPECQPLANELKAQGYTACSSEVTTKYAV